MWEFFDHVFSQGGFVALTAVASVAIFGGTVRVLWNENQALHRGLSTKQDEHEKAMRTAQDGYASSYRTMQEQYATTLRTLMDQHMVALTKLHEQRYEEAQATQERVLQHLTKVDTTLQKVGTAMDIMIDVVSGRSDVVAGRRRDPRGGGG